jgi:hypothetical protein
MPQPDLQLLRQCVGWGAAATAVQQLAPVAVFAAAQPPADMAVTLARAGSGAANASLVWVGFRAPVSVDGFAGPALLFDGESDWVDALRDNAGPEGAGLRLVLAGAGRLDAVAAAARKGWPDVTVVEIDVDAGLRFAVADAARARLPHDFEEVIRMRVAAVDRALAERGPTPEDLARGAIELRGWFVRAYLEAQLGARLRHLRLETRL